MAYGKNEERKDWDYRALPLAVGNLTGFKQTELALLQTLVLDLMREMAVKCFDYFPLISVIDNKDLEKKLIVIQKSATGLNSAWCEQARMRVKPALEHINEGYFKRLAGCLRYADSLVPVYPLTATQEKKINEFIGPLEPQDPKRIYIHVPVSIQDTVTEQELNALKLIGEAKGVIDWFKDVIVNGNISGLTANQHIIVQDIYDRAQAKHLPPEFGAKDSFTLQLHLDVRMLPKHKKSPNKLSEALQLRGGEDYFLRDDENVKYRRFIDISGVKAHGKRIRIPVTLTREISRRMEGSRKDFASIIVELTNNTSGETQVGVRLVCGKPEPVFDLTKVSAIVGRDFGFTNSICLSVALSQTPIDLSEPTSAIRANSMKEAKAFPGGALQTHTLPDDVEIVERLRFSGKNFLAKINYRCEKIDGYKSKIDLAYNELEKLKALIFNELNLGEFDLITKAHKKLSSLAGDFFALFGKINDLKKARRDQYKKIKALKKNWFGFLNNQEVKLAKKYNAIIVRENLTIETTKKYTPAYFGRVFNKMINNGSKGQYQKKATAKHAWNCIREFCWRGLIGSWYTSRACAEHAVVVEKKHRDGEKLYLHCCGKTVHADEHAADTIACYLFLKPVVPELIGTLSSNL